MKAPKTLENRRRTPQPPATGACVLRIAVRGSCVNVAENALAYISRTTRHVGAIDAMTEQVSVVPRQLLFAVFTNLQESFSIINGAAHAMPNTGLDA